jgi:hypothetical protein
VFSTTTAAQGVVPGSSGAAATSFLNATGAWSVPAGGGGAPGGSTTQVQYNNAGAFGGISNVTTNGTALTELSFAPSASTSAFVIHGSSFTTTGININSNGNILLGGDGSGITIDISSSLGVRGNSIVQTVPAIVFTDTAGAARGTSSWWEAGTPSVSGIIEQRYTTVPQTYRVYNTTDVGATNYERGVLDWTTTGNTLIIGQQFSGTGQARPVGIVAGNNRVYNFGVAPATKTTAYTVVDGDQYLTFNGSASITVTLPAANSYTGREITMKTIAAFTVVSASSNVVPIGSATAGTAILAATVGKFVTLVSDGTNWITVQGN